MNKNIIYFFLGCCVLMQFSALRADGLDSCPLSNVEMGEEADVNSGVATYDSEKSTFKIGQELEFVLKDSNRALWKTITRIFKLSTQQLLYGNVKKLLKTMTRCPWGSDYFY